jgi:glycosyltransferase involved in cell wall biosynthesis
MPFYAPKGSSLRVLSILEKLVKRFDVDVIAYPHGEDPSIQGLSIFRTTQRVKPELGVATVSLKRVMLDKLVFLKSFGMMLRNDYDVVHCEDFEAASIGAVLSFFFPGKKYVYDLHNSIVDNLEISGKSKLFLSVARVIERFVLSRFDKVIINWEMYKDHPVLSKKDTFLYYDKTNLKTEKIKLPVKGRMWSYVGNFKEYQGVGEFLSAYAKAKVKTPLVLVGNMENKIEEKIKDLKLEKQVHITGVLPIEQANYIQMSSELCLIPRTYGRQPGMKAMHILMLGRVALATDIPANTDILSDNDSILYKSEEELIDILKRVESGKYKFSALEKGIADKQKVVNKIWSDEYFLNNYMKDE